MQGSASQALAATRRRDTEIQDVCCSSLDGHHGVAHDLVLDLQHRTVIAHLDARAKYLCRPGKTRGGPLNGDDVFDIIEPHGAKSWCGVAHCCTHSAPPALTRMAFCSPSGHRRWSRMARIRSS